MGIGQAWKGRAVANEKAARFSSWTFNLLRDMIIVNGIILLKRAFSAATSWTGSFDLFFYDSFPEKR